MNLLVNLDVDDIGKAIRFYSDAFGLRVGCRFGNFAVEMLGSSVLMADPFGHGFCLIQFIGRGYDEIAG